MLEPRYTHRPYTPHQPLLEVHSQQDYPANYLRGPRYGLPRPPPSALTTSVGAVPSSVGLGESLPTGPSGRPGPPLREPCAPRGARNMRPRPPDATRLLTPSAGRHRGLRQHRCAPPSPERIAVLGCPPRRCDDPRNPPTYDRPPLEGDTEGATGAVIMMVLASTTVRLTARPNVPRSTMTSHDRRDAPQVAPPPPLVVATVLSPGTTTAPAVAHPMPPPRGGPTINGTTPTGIGVGPTLDTAWCLHYDTPETGHPLEWEPRTAPHTRLPRMAQDEPPRKRHRGHKRGQQTET